MSTFNFMGTARTSSSPPARAHNFPASSSDYARDLAASPCATGTPISIFEEAANIKFTTIVSGFHRVRPIIKLADGTLLIGDQAEGSVADYHEYQISFSECRWLRLDPVRGVTLGGTWVQPDLSKVDEVGYFDVIPGSGAWTAEGLPVEKQPPPPAGGWIAVSTFELFGRLVSRK